VSWCLPRKNNNVPPFSSPCVRIDFFLYYFSFLCVRLFVCLLVFYSCVCYLLCSMENVVFNSSSVSCSVLNDMCSKQCVLNHSIHQLPITNYSLIHPLTHIHPYPPISTKLSTDRLSNHFQIHIHSIASILLFFSRLVEFFISYFPFSI